MEQAEELAGEAHTAMRETSACPPCARSTQRRFAMAPDPDRPCSPGHHHQGTDQTESLLKQKASWNLPSRATGPPEGFQPWFDVPGRRSANTTIVCGHWAAMGLRLTPNMLALDSGCVYGRQLTAVRLEDRKVFQVRCEETRGGG